MTTPTLIAEADTPWGRVRVTAWTARPLSALERAKKCRTIAHALNSIDPRTDETTMLRAAEKSIAGPSRVLAEVLR